jgi:hypothetical protein
LPVLPNAKASIFFLEHPKISQCIFGLDAFAFGVKPMGAKGAATHRRKGYRVPHVPLTSCAKATQPHRPGIHITGQTALLFLTIYSFFHAKSTLRSRIIPPPGILLNRTECALKNRQRTRAFVKK